MTTVLLDVDGPLARITLNRPHRLNAVDEALAHDLDHAVSDRSTELPPLRAPPTYFAVSAAAAK